MRNGFNGRLMLVVMTACLLISCGKKESSNNEIWKEQLRLMNGDLIIIDRRNGYGPSGESSQMGGPMTKAEVRFDYKGKHYEWVHRGVWPLAIQEDSQGRMYIVSALPYCWAWSEWGKPPGYYVVHRFEEGGWKRLDITEVDPETAFNLAGSNRKPRSTAYYDYVPEAAMKFSTNRNTDEPNRKIVLSHRPNCR